MEKLNIAAILKDKPQGTKLYSSACGKCELKEVDDKSFKVSFYSSKFGFMNGGEGTFDKNGKLYDDGECVVFPSKEMRDWRKFSWKKGDVLVDTGFDNINCIFDAYISEDYTRFRARYCYRLSPCSNDIWFSNPTQIFSTKEFMKDPCPSLFIKKIEEHYKGKLNLETLEIDALAKEGKCWNPDTKQFEDLPKKCKFKPMDWCLMRDKKETWKLCQFSFFDGDYEAPYNAVGGNWFDECIPYNEETKHLLGTTDKWKGGEQ